MQTAIRDIGSYLLYKSNESFLNHITLPVPEKIENRTQHILKINLNNKSKKVELSIEAISSKTHRKYLWIGNADGPSSPQWYFSTTNIDYIISQTLPNLIEKFDEDSKLIKLLKKTKNNFFYDLGPQVKSKSRYRYVLDLKFLDEKLICMDKIMEKNQGNVKKIISEINKVLLDYIKKEIRLSKKEIYLCHLMIDGKSITDEKEYRELVVSEKIHKLFKKSQTGICHVCGIEDKITDNTSRLEFKYYITDKKGFASNFKNDFYNNMGVCENCYKRLLVGEIYSKYKLRHRIGGVSFLIIPSFLFSKELNKDEVENWTNEVMNSVGPAIKFENIQAMNKKIEKNLRADKENSYILNFLFYDKKPASLEFKVQKLIKDIHPTRIKEMHRASQRIAIFANDLLGESKYWNIHLNRIYYLTPIRKGEKGITEYKKLLSLYDQIFTQKPISYRQLVKQFVELIGVYRFEKFNSYNVSKSKDGFDDLNYVPIQMNLMMKYLYEINILERRRGMDTEALNLNSSIEKFIKEMQYEEENCALFLLGYLIGEVGNAQRNADLPSEPILNKLNYQGMSTIKIDRLINEIPEKLRQYKGRVKDKDINLLYLNNNTYGVCNKLWIKHRKDWKLTNQENVLYILSGYSFNNMLRINHKKIGGN